MVSVHDLLGLSVLYLSPPVLYQTLSCELFAFPGVCAMCMSPHVTVVTCKKCLDAKFPLSRQCLILSGLGVTGCKQFPAIWSVVTPWSLGSYIVSYQTLCIPLFKPCM